MNVLDAVYSVLSEATTPLHYGELTKRILARGLWSTSGKTPWATVNAKLAVDIRTHGDSSRFYRVGPGVFTVRRSTQSPAAEPTNATEEAEHSTPATSPMSFLDAAEQVLLESRTPMRHTEIIDRALAAGLIQTVGRTPAATLSARVGDDIRRREALGDRQRFVRPSRGMIALAPTRPSGVAAMIEQQNREVRTQLLRQAQEGDPADFERLIATLLVKMGFDDVEVTRISGDGGVDVRGILVVGDVVRVRMAVQAKRWQGNVGAPIVQQVRGSLGAHEQGLIITTSDFGSGAREEAARADASPVALMNGEQLAILLAENEVGVLRNEHVLLMLEQPDEAGG